MEGGGVGRPVLRVARTGASPARAHHPPTEAARMVNGGPAQGGQADGRPRDDIVLPSEYQLGSPRSRAEASSSLARVMEIQRQAAMMPHYPSSQWIDSFMQTRAGVEGTRYQQVPPQQPPFENLYNQLAETAVKNTERCQPLKCQNFPKLPKKKPSKRSSRERERSVKAVESPESPTSRPVVRSSSAEPQPRPEPVADPYRVSSAPGSQPSYPEAIHFQTNYQPTQLYTAQPTVSSVGQSYILHTSQPQYATFQHTVSVQPMQALYSTFDPGSQAYFPSQEVAGGGGVYWPQTNGSGQCYRGEARPAGAQLHHRAVNLQATHPVTIKVQPPDNGQSMVLVC